MSIEVCSVCLNLPGIFSSIFTSSKLKQKKFQDDAKMYCTHSDIRLLDSLIWKDRKKNFNFRLKEIVFKLFSVEIRKLLLMFGQFILRIDFSDFLQCESVFLFSLLRFFFGNVEKEALVKLKV